MAITYYYGNIPVSSEELQEKSSFLDTSKKDFTDQELEFKHGKIRFRDLMDISSNDYPSFTPIGINKPLSIEILMVYAGDVPRKFLGRKPDIMTVSGIKSYITYGASPRAVNHIKRKVEDHSFISISAFDPGSPIVYYTSAVDASTIYCSLELVADSFNRKTITHIEDLFRHAGHLPIFAPVSPFLIAGSMISSVGGNVLESVIETDAFLKEDLIFRFDTPALPVSIARQMVVCNSRDQEELMGFQPGLIEDVDGSKAPALVHRTSGKAYSGDAPYILLNADGKKRPELEGFTPKLATAALLERFYGASDKSKQSFQMLEDALSLYNDLRYVQKAQDMEKKLKNVSKDSDEYKRSIALYEAYLKNIRHEEMKI